MRYAVINSTTHLVENIILLGDPAAWPVPAGSVIVQSDEAGSIGDTWTGGTNFTSPPAPPPTPEQVLAVAIAAGCQIVSTATPALNGTYAINETAQRNISAVAAGIAARNRVPGGGATFNYRDAAGAPHAFGAADFLNFASAIEDYVYALSNGQAPAQPVQIA